MALVVSFVAITTSSYAASKTRAALQTDLDNNKIRTFNALLMHEDHTTMNDSYFNLATDGIDAVTGITATNAELNNVADDSVRIVTLTGAVTLTCALNGTGIINYISSSASNATITIPAATGAGCSFDLLWQAAPTGSGDTVQVTGNDEFQGLLQTLTDDADNMEAWKAAIGSDNDSISLTSSTQLAAGGLLRMKITDVDTDTLAIEGVGNSTGTEVTPFATGQRP